MHDIEVYISDCTKAKVFADRVRDVLADLLPEDEYRFRVFVTDIELNGIDPELEESWNMACRCIPAFCRGCNFMPPPEEDEEELRYLPMIVIDGKPVHHSRLLKTEAIKRLLNETGTGSTC